MSKPIHHMRERHKTPFRRSTVFLKLRLPAQEREPVRLWAWVVSRNGSRMLIAHTPASGKVMPNARAAPSRYRITRRAPNA